QEGLTPEPRSLQGRVQFEHLYFRYPSRPDVQIYSDFSLSIEPGTTCALVGGSGSGKSTAVQLLLRFYDPDAGRVLLDGMDITTLQLKWLRQQIGLVGQEPILFDGTIAQVKFLNRPYVKIRWSLRVLPQDKDHDSVTHFRSSGC
ncbi:P-loop containing nucleoside triphosphate hydrolase protein, partial [Pavlovales sp. CCMP2436]